MAFLRVDYVPAISAKSDALAHTSSLTHVPVFQHLCVWAVLYGRCAPRRCLGCAVTVSCGHTVHTDMAHVANDLQELFQVTRKNHVTDERAASPLSP